MKRLNHLKTMLSLVLLLLVGANAWGQESDTESLTIDFSSSITSYSDWVFSDDFSIIGTDGFATVNVKADNVASVTTKNRIFFPKSISFRISQENAYDTEAVWKVQYSQNGTDWVDATNPVSATTAEWKDVSATFGSSVCLVYVRVLYQGTTSAESNIKRIDDINLVCAKTYAIKRPANLTNGSVTVQVKYGEEYYDVDNVPAGTEVKVSASPDESYLIDSPLSVTYGNSGVVTIENGIFTMPSSDVDISVSFREAVSNRVYFNMNGSVIGTRTKIYKEGENVALTAPNVKIPKDYEFIGWSLSPIEGECTDRANANLVTDYVMGTNAANFYAVFGKVAIKSSLEQKGLDITSYNQSNLHLEVPQNGSTTITQIKISLKSNDAQVIFTVQDDLTNPTKQVSVTSCKGFATIECKELGLTSAYVVADSYAGIDNASAFYGSEATYSEYITNFTSVNVSINTTIGYSTMYYSDSEFIVPEGVTATTYKIVDGALSVSRIYSPTTDYKVIPAGEAVVLYKTGGGETAFNLGVATTSVDTDNILKGTDDGCYTNKDYSESNYVFYGLNYVYDNQENPIPGFYWCAANGGAFQVGAHKAYIPMLKTTQVKSFIFADLDDYEEETAVSSIKALTDDVVYSLSGQRVIKARKGVYIKNGKKYISK